MRNTKKIFIAYLIGLLLILGLFIYIGGQNIINAFTEFQIIYIVPVICIFLLVPCLNTLNLKIMYSPIIDLRYSLLLKKYLISWSLGTLLPSRVAEFSLAYFLKEKVSIGKSTAILVIDKIISIIVFSFFSILGIIYFFGFKKEFYFLLFLILCIFLIIIVILSEKVRNLLKKTVLSKIKHHFTGFSKTIQNYLKYRKKIIFANFTLSVVRLFLQSIVLFFLFLGFNETISLLLLIYIMSINTILSLLPITPGGLGIKQISLVFFISLLGVDIIKAASVGLISVSINYAIVLIIFFFGAFKSIKGII